MTMRISVVLPAPLRPTRPTMAPLPTACEKPRSAGIDRMSTYEVVDLEQGALLIRAARR